MCPINLFEKKNKIKKTVLSPDIPFKHFFSKDALNHTHTYMLYISLILLIPSDSKAYSCLHCCPDGIGEWLALLMNCLFFPLCSLIPSPVSICQGSFKITRPKRKKDATTEKQRQRECYRRTRDLVRYLDWTFFTFLVLIMEDCGFLLVWRRHGTKMELSTILFLVA